MDFWSELLEDSPDLVKVRSTGRKVGEAREAVDRSWVQLREGHSHL